MLPEKSTCKNVDFEVNISNVDWSTFFDLSICSKNVQCCLKPSGNWYVSAILQQFENVVQSTSNVYQSTFLWKDEKYFFSAKKARDVHLEMDTSGDYSTFDLKNFVSAPHWNVVGHAKQGRSPTCGMVRR
jgi:hypothetical protein